jgi:hypothetical protein
VSENTRSEGLTAVITRACDLLDETEEFLASFERRGGVGGADLAIIAGWIDRVFTAVQTMARLDPETRNRHNPLMEQLDQLHQQTRTAIKSGNASAIRPLIEATQHGLRALVSSDEASHAPLNKFAAASAEENQLAADCALNDRSLIADLAEFTRADACASLSSRSKSSPVASPDLRISRAD